MQLSAGSQTLDICHHFIRQAADLVLPAVLFRIPSFYNVFLDKLSRMINHQALLWMLLVAMGVGTGCKSGNVTATKALDGELKMACTTWKQDPFGCKKGRVSALAEQIATRFQELKLDEAAIEDHLGLAETESMEEGFKTLTYYFDTTCENGRPAPDSVYCVLEFRMLDSGCKMGKAGVVCG